MFCQVKRTLNRSQETLRKNGGKTYNKIIVKQKYNAGPRPFTISVNQIELLTHCDETKFIAASHITYLEIRGEKKIS